MSARYPNGHSRRKDSKPRKPRWDRGPLSAHWKGGVTTKDGYVVQTVGARKRAHVAIVEAVLGRELPASSVVHHVNGVKNENRNDNLAVLQDRIEHVELHRKMSVQSAGGDPWRDRLCRACLRCKPTESFYALDSSKRWPQYSTKCVECARADARKRGRIKHGYGVRHDFRHEASR